MDDDKSIKYVDINTNISQDVVYIGSLSKQINFLDIVANYKRNIPMVIYDKTNKTLENYILSNTRYLDTTFDMLFWTSGTTGLPVGAYKTADNITQEVATLKELLKDFHIDNIVVTVAFVHIYGAILGLFYGYLNDINIQLREHFLPFDLLDSIKPNSMVVATPMYIEALVKIETKQKFVDTVFVCSTAPLCGKIAKKFIDKYDTTILSLFGSTETGGIAYKFDDDKLWSVLDKVDIRQDSDHLMSVKSPYLSQKIFDGGIKNTDKYYKTFDYIDKIDDKFELLGRQSSIFKIAGKRYSTALVENILKTMDGIQECIVTVDDTGNIKCLIQSQTIYSKSEITKQIRQNMTNLKPKIDIDYVNISQTQTGKKIVTQKH